MRVLSIGEVLWDVFPNGEFLGGAPLNVCANLIRCDDDAALISAVGDDRRGADALEKMRSLGMPTDLVRTIADRPTGTASVGEDSDGQPIFTINRPAAYDAIALTPEILEKVNAFDPEWLYMGTLLQTKKAMEDLIEDLLARLPNVRCFYDMNLRHGHWNLALIERLCQRASLLKLNEMEAETLAALTKRD